EALRKPGLWTCARPAPIERSSIGSNMTRSIGSSCRQVDPVDRARVSRCLLPKFVREQATAREETAPPAILGLTGASDEPGAGDVRCVSDRVRARDPGRTHWPLSRAARAHAAGVR